MNQVSFSGGSTGPASGMPYPPSSGRGATLKRIPPWLWVLIGVLAAVACIFFLLVMLLVIPTLGNTKKRANEISAISSLHAITQAQFEYESTYVAAGFACDLKALGGESGSGVPTPTAAQLLDNDLASSGYKSGYNFKIASCEKVTVNGTDRITGYQLTAVPAAPGKTGNRGFCTDEAGQIKFDPAGGVNCTQMLGQ